MMHNPPHPGTLLGEDVIKALGLKITEVARRLGVSRVSLSRVVNGHAALSPELAHRLELAGVGTARAWLAMQVNYDLAALQQQPQPTVRALDTQPDHHKHPV
ncbi:MULTISPECIES: HigA family addiction module antitoxin [Aeromonas]|uniref:HigA family addiction module antitoxin n=1 Tax=Aeromonas caviae TaxID=648 RepID=UPI000E965098|nr:addiction module antidote protein, HigA family [Aeromonas salmonicida]